LIKVKICGVTLKEDALMIDNLGVHYIGIIIDENLARGVSLEKALEISSSIKTAKPVAVIVNHKKLSLIDKLSNTFEIFQLHYNPIPKEDVNFIASLGLKVSPVIIIDPNGNDFDISLISELNTLKNKIEYLLIDVQKSSKTINQNGLKLPLDFYNKFCSLFRPCGVAGGINPENVQFFKEIKPDVIDVSSGVEIKVGKKDPIKIKKLIEVVKNL